MRGRRVERRFGWDTHGLPAELEAQRQLGLKTKQDIVELGIEAFNAKCRESVLTYTDEWREYVTRQARWVDFDNDYKTMNPEFMESVIWAFKQLWDKGLVYEGFRILPYCWNDQTPLSNHELRMDEDVYQNRQDPAITVGFRLETGELALIWTTTPWTLPSNMGLAVHPDVDYVVVEGDRDGGSERYLLAQARLAAYAARARPRRARERVVARLKGSELLGRTLHPAVHLLRGVCRRAPGARRGLRHDRGRHRPGAHVAGLRRGRQAHPRRGRGRDRRAGRAPTGGSFGRSPTTRACTSSTRTRTSSTTSRRGRGAGRHRGRPRGDQPGHGPGPARDLRPRLPALLALPRAAHLHGGVVVVRRGDEVQGSYGRAQPADRVDARARQGRPVRQVAGERPRLVDLTKPLLGQPYPGLEVGQPGIPSG